MENFSNPAVIWFLIGFVLFLLELALPGLVLLFFGVGCWIVGSLTFIFDLSFNYQLIIFLATSLLFLLLFRRWLQNKLGGKNQSTEIMEDEFIGKTALAETVISPSHKGKVIFKGASWSAKSDDVIQPGENVLITGNESIVLIVKSKKTS